MLKRIVLFFVCFTFFLSTFTIKSYASNIEEGYPWSDYRFRPYTSSSNIVDMVSGQHCYAFITVQKDYSKPIDSINSFFYTLYLIYDDEHYNNKVFFDLRSSPDSTKFYQWGSGFNTIGGNNVSFDNGYIYTYQYFFQTTDGIDTSYFSSTSFSTGVAGWCFDNCFSDKFPSYYGSSTHYPRYILASTVDIYDLDGNLLQYGNYDSFCNFFTEDLSLAFKDFSTHTEPTTTVTENSSSDGTSQEQLETSKGILGTLKDVLSYIINLPQKIAESIGDFFTMVKDGIVSALEALGNFILDGLKFLFVPSDNLFNDLQEKINVKFKFLYQVIDLGESIISAEYLDEPPNNKLTIYGVTITFMDWELYDKYKPIINTIIIIVSYYFYIQRLIKRLPGVIGGFHR